jgi:endoglucanase
MSANADAVAMSRREQMKRRLAVLLLAAGVAVLAQAFAVPFTQSHQRASVITYSSISTTVEAHQTYTVVGNRIVNSRGQTVLLHGVNRSSLENTCTGATVAGEETGIPASDFATMHNRWGATIVRLPLDQYFWLSKCRGYRATVKRAVEEIQANHMLAILDLHWWTEPPNLSFATGSQAICMPNNNSVTFWRQVANTYRTDPGVWFELYNEPDPIANTVAAQWRIWLDGGAASCNNDNTLKPMGTFSTVGMQTLVNAIRATGAQNIVLADGIGHPGTLEGVPLLAGGNIAYAIWPYAPKTGWSYGEWDRRFGNLAQQVPVVATEFGDFECGNGLYAHGYDQAILGYFRTHQISYLAWDWFAKYPCEVPELVANASGACRNAMACTIQQDMKSYLPVGAVSLARSPTVFLNSDTTTVRLSCAGTASCGGRLTLTLPKHQPGNGEKIAAAGFSIPQGATKTVSLEIAKPARAFLGSSRDRTATLTIAETSPAPGRVRRMPVHVVPHKPN